MSTHHGKCPKCATHMKRLTVYDVRDGDGRWVNAEFTICPRCTFPCLRVLESTHWRIIVRSDGVLEEMEVRE